MSGSSPGFVMSLMTEGTGCGPPVQDTDFPDFVLLRVDWRLPRNHTCCHCTYHEIRHIIVGLGQSVAVRQLKQLNARVPGTTTWSRVKINRLDPDE